MRYPDARLPLCIQLRPCQHSDNLRMCIWLIAANLSEDLVQLLLVVVVGGRRPVVQAILAWNPVSICSLEVVDAAEPAHDSTKAFPVVQLVALMR